MLGPKFTDILWPYFDLAETQRLISIYGYPKDNALPPSLAERIHDPVFVSALQASIADSLSDSTLHPSEVHTLQRALVCLLQTVQTTAVSA